MSKKAEETSLFTPKNSAKASRQAKVCPKLVKKQKASRPSLRGVKKAYTKTLKQAAYMELSQVLASVDLLQVYCTPRMQDELRQAQYHILNSLEMAMELDAEQVSCGMAKLWFVNRLIFNFLFLAVLGREHEGDGDKAGIKADIGPSQGGEAAGQVRSNESELSEVRETSKLSEDLRPGGDERQRECVPGIMLRKVRKPTGDVMTLPEGTMIRRVSCSEMRGITASNVLEGEWPDPDDVDVDAVDGCVDDLAR